MTGSNTDSNSVSSAQCFWLAPSGLYVMSSSGLCLLNPASASQPISQQRLSLADWLRVMLFAIGLLYAMTSMAGEYLYADGYNASSVATAVESLRQSAEMFPLSSRFRKASALYLSHVAETQHTKEWAAAALPEINQALVDDPTSADLLHYKRVFEHE
jgi:hypothetical protein